MYIAVTKWYNLGSISFELCLCRQEENYDYHCSHDTRKRNSHPGCCPMCMNVSLHQGEAHTQLSSPLSCPLQSPGSCTSLLPKNIFHIHCFCRIYSEHHSPKPKWTVPENGPHSAPSLNTLSHSLKKDYSVMGTI